MTPIGIKLLFIGAALEPCRQRREHVTPEGYHMIAEYLTSGVAVSIGRQLPMAQSCSRPEAPCGLESAQAEPIRLADWRLPDGSRVRLILENTRSAKPSRTGWVLRQNASLRTRPSTCHLAWAPSLKKM